MTCTSCAHWQIKESQLARAGFAACALGKRYTHVSANHTCDTHKPATPEITAARMGWMEKNESRRMA